MESTNDDRPIIQGVVTAKDAGAFVDPTLTAKEVSLEGQK